MNNMLSTWLISWRNLTSQKKKVFITLIAMVLGVAFLTAMLVSDRTTKDVFTYYEEMYVGNADYWILSDNHTLQEDAVRELEAHPAVAHTLTALDKQDYLVLEESRSQSERSVRVTGVSDQASPLLMMPVIEGSLDNDGVVLPESVAELLDKTVGETVTFEGMGELPISAIVEYTQLLSSPESWDAAGSSSFRVMAPLNVVQQQFGLEDEVSYVRVQTTNQTEGAAWYQEMEEILSGSQAYIQPVVADDRQSNDIEGLYTFFYLIAALAIFISGFIIFNMIYTSVMERKKEFAIMKSLGYEQWSVSKLVLSELFLLSIISVLVGVPLGVFLGDLFMQAILGVFAFDMVYELNWVGPAMIAGIIGMIFPAVFSFFPIYSAGKTSILLSLKEGNQLKEAGYLSKWIRPVVGIVLIGLVWIDHLLTYISVLIGLVLLFPLILRGIHNVASSFLRTYPGRLARMNLMQQLGRNANTASILAVGVAVILLLAAAVKSAPDQYEEDIRATFGGDIRVTSESSWTEEQIQEIKDLDSVTKVEPLKEATPITWLTNEGEERQFSVIGVNEQQTSLFHHQPETTKKLYEGLSIALGERAFIEWGGEIGGSILMRTVHGEQEFIVVDVVQTSHYSGYVAFMLDTGLHHDFGWTGAKDLMVTIDDESANDIRDQIWEMDGGHISKIETVDDKIRSTTSAITGMSDLMLILMITVIALASVGTANTLLMNALERAKEIVTMRAIGFTTQQVSSMLIIEGILVGVSGIAGGIVFGILLIYFMSKSAWMDGFMTFQLPFDTIILTVVAGILLSLLAAWYASRSATRLDIQSSIREG
ncbi:FtsX-like permease family protein [Alkalicoccobacillus gibsonii]|uniref:FtsX-like permease family protein n=1 Tax=Alkalicoccobacillus gibsonii TaxID=79881 RepID=A0ABU9VDI0_9BACI